MIQKGIICAVLFLILAQNTLGSRFNLNAKSSNGWNGGNANGEDGGNARGQDGGNTRGKFVINFGNAQYPKGEDMAIHSSIHLPGIYIAVHHSDSDTEESDSEESESDESESDESDSDESDLEEENDNLSWIKRALEKTPTVQSIVEKEKEVEKFPIDVEKESKLAILNELSYSEVQEINNRLSTLFDKDTSDAEMNKMLKYINNVSEGVVKMVENKKPKENLLKRFSSSISGSFNKGDDKLNEPGSISRTESTGDKVGKGTSINERVLIDGIEQKIPDGQPGLSVNTPTVRIESIGGTNPNSDNGNTANTTPQEPPINRFLPWQTVINSGGNVNGSGIQKTGSINFGNMKIPNGIPIMKPNLLASNLGQILNRTASFNSPIKMPSTTVSLDAGNRVNGSGVQQGSDIVVNDQKDYYQQVLKTK